MYEIYLKQVYVKNIVILKNIDFLKVSNSSQYLLVSLQMQTIPQTWELEWNSGVVQTVENRKIPRLIK